MWMCGVCRCENVRDKTNVHLQFWESIMYTVTCAIFEGRVAYILPHTFLITRKSYHFISLSLSGCAHTSLWMHTYISLYGWATLSNSLSKTINASRKRYHYLHHSLSLDQSQKHNMQCKVGGATVSIQLSKTRHACNMGGAPASISTKLKACNHYRLCNSPKQSMHGVISQLWPNMSSSSSLLGALELYFKKRCSFKNTECCTAP